MHGYPSAVLLSALTLLSFSNVMADYRTLKTANELFEAGQFTEASELYRNVIRDEPESRNGTVAAYNFGNTLFRTSHFAEAAVQFRKAARQPELPVTFRVDARFNAGNAFARLAMLADGNLQKKKLLKASLREYRSALLMDPDDQESKINHEIVLRLLKTLSPPPPGKGKRPSDTQRSGAQNDVASNILERAAKEERAVVQNSYRNASPEKQAPSNKDW